MATDLTQFFGGGGGGGIKSVQRGFGYYTNYATYNITITSVDTSKSFVTVSWAPGGNLPLDQAFATAKLTSSTNLEIFRSNGGNGTYVAWEVVEFA